MNSTEPQITVVMPVYNGAKYIKEAIQSILDQTYKNFILLVINDGSPDNSEEIIKSFNDTRIKYVKNEVNLGLANTLNKGMEIATTKYIARMDQDDISRPYRLEREKNYLDSHPEIALVGGGYAPFTAEKGHRIDIFHPTDSVIIAFKFLYNSYFCHPVVMFRKDILGVTGNYPNVVPEDYPFFSKIVRSFPTANIKEILIDYRETPTGMSQTMVDKFIPTVKRVSKENYAFYIGDENGYDELYNYFQNNDKRLNLKVLSCSAKIIWKIANTYYSFPINIYNFIKYYLIIVFKSQLKKLIQLFS